MAETEQLLTDAYSALAERRWSDAHAGFAAARARADLRAEDVAAMGEAAWWQGEIDECLGLLEDAYQRYLSREDPPVLAAGKLAMEIGYFWLLRGEEAIGSGWLGRARRLLEPFPDSVEYGYLLTTEMDDALARGDLDRAVTVSEQVLAVGRNHGDDTLEAVALVGEGIATAKRGDVASGMAILDEAMLPVVEGRVEAAYAGNIYCQLMQVCDELADLGRARLWTDAAARWCDGFESAVMFVGVCRVHRAALLQRRGQWARAEAEARRVCEELAALDVAAAAEGYYLLAEAHRLRGDLTPAEEAYLVAHQWGRDPQPGLSLLRLAEGHADVALRGVTGAVQAASDQLARAAMLPAVVEIAQAAGDAQLAREAAAELDRAADVYASSGLLAEAAEARGRVALVDGDPSVAIRELGSAARRWTELEVPYRAARVRVELARAHAARDEPDAADMELEAASATFERLGARHDILRLAHVRARPGLPGGLTPREAEILRVVADGLSNREVAEQLVLSEKTVARHLHNIYAKLGVSSRTAAVAYAYQHGLAAAPSNGLHTTM